MKLLFYDHDQTSAGPGDLERLARALGTEGFRPGFRERGRESDLSKAIAAKDWHIGVVHVELGTWESLLRACDGERVLVRVSGEGFQPCALESVQPLAVRWLEPISKIDSGRLRTALDRLMDSSVREGLRRSIVDAALGTVLRFRRPDYAAGLWIAGIAHLIRMSGLLQGRSGKAGHVLATYGFASPAKAAPDVGFDVLSAAFAGGEVGLAGRVEDEFGLERGKLPPKVEYVVRAFEGHEVDDLDAFAEGLEELGNELRISKIA